MKKKLILLFIISIFFLSSVSAEAASKPSKVTLTSLKAKSQNSISVSWKKVSKARGYEIYCDNKLVKRLTARSFTHTGLRADTGYKYKVRAFTTTKQKQWFNKKTKKWQKKKPTKKYRGKSKKKTVRIYGAFSAVRYVKTLHKHAFGEWKTIVIPTCDKDGLDVRTCSCGKREEKSIPKTGHSYSEWTISKHATCTSFGEEIRICQNDPSHIEKRDIPKTDHRWSSERTVVKEPTCYSTGETGITCLNCGKVKDPETLPKKEHNFRETVIREATCSKEGEKGLLCETCGEIKNKEAIPAKDHIWGEEISTSPTCTEDGRTYRVCTLCSKEETLSTKPAEGHAFSEWENVKMPSCSEEGLKMRSCAECSFTETKGLEKSSHDWEEEKTIDKAPTCTQDGSASIHCKNCDAVKESEIVPSTGHTFGDFEIEVAATCTHEGKETSYCTSCGMAGESRQIPAIDHPWDSGVVKKNAKCGINGQKIYTCTMCKTTRSEIIPMLDHEWEKEVIASATCTSREYSKLTCKYCKEFKYANTSDILPHDFGEKTLIKEASCSEEGLKAKVCKVCGFQGEKETIPKTAHEGDWVVTKEPSACEIKDGTMKKYCSSCGVYMETKKFQREHEWEDGYSLDVEPTCTIYGKESIHCKFCDSTKDTRTLPLLEHDYSGDWVVTREATQTKAGNERTTCVSCGRVWKNRGIPKIITEEEQAFADSLDGKEFTIWCIGIELPELKETISLPQGYKYYMDIDLPGWEITKKDQKGSETIIATEDEPITNINSIGATTTDTSTLSCYMDPARKDLTDVDWEYTATKNDQEISFTVHRRDYGWKIYEDALNEFISTNISGNMSEYDKMVTSAKYVAKFPYSPASKHCYWPQSVIMAGHGVCNAKANMLEDILDSLDIESHIHSPSGEIAGSAHANNVVRLKDNGMYYVEATAGEPVIRELTEDGLYANGNVVPYIEYTYDWFEGMPDTVTFFDSVPEIRADNANGLFYSSYHITKNGPRKIIVPEAVTSIVDGSLAGGRTIKEVEIAEENPVYEVRADGCIYNKSENSLVFIPPAMEKETLEINCDIRAFAISNVIGTKNIHFGENAKPLSTEMMTGDFVPTVDENNPYMYESEGCIYSKENDKALYEPYGTVWVNPNI